ncbi:MAG: twitching motility protein PilT, partial [Anaerolineae bacterium]|nr:twitching motility protein PilT [Anaerolineae bacterium]
RPFQRCLVCNGWLEPVDKTLIRDQLPAGIWADNNEFHRCQGCHQIYWKGSHLTRMERFVVGILAVKGKKYG